MYRHTRVRKSNPYAALTVLAIIGILFMGYYVALKPFGILYNKFTNDSDYHTRFPTESKCLGHGYWDGTQCDQLPARAKSVMERERYVWLLVPFIVVVGLIIWFVTVSSKKDYQEFQ